MKKAYAILLIVGLVFTAARTTIPVDGKAGPPGAVIDKAVIMNDVSPIAIELQTVEPVFVTDEPVQHAVMITQEEVKFESQMPQEADERLWATVTEDATSTNLDPGKYEVQLE